MKCKPQLPSSETGGKLLLQNSPEFWHRLLQSQRQQQKFKQKISSWTITAKTLLHMLQARVFQRLTPALDSFTVKHPGLSLKNTCSWKVRGKQLNSGRGGKNLLRTSRACKVLLVHGKPAWIYGCSSRTSHFLFSFSSILLLTENKQPLH